MKNTSGSKVGRLSICQLWKFEWKRRGTKSKKRQKWVKKERKKINAALTGNRTRDLSITDQMNVLTNQVLLKRQFRHRFDQKCPFTDSLQRLGSRFARTSSVPLEIIWKEIWRSIYLFSKGCFLLEISLENGLICFGAG